MVVETASGDRDYKLGKDFPECLDRLCWSHYAPLKCCGRTTGRLGSLCARIAANFCGTAPKVRTFRVQEVVESLHYRVHSRIRFAEHRVCRGGKQVLYPRKHKLKFRSVEVEKIGFRSLSVLLDDFGQRTQRLHLPLAVLQARISSWIAHGHNQTDLISDEPQYLAGRRIRIAHLRDDFWQLGVGQDSLPLLFGDYHCMVALQLNANHICFPHPLAPKPTAYLERPRALTRSRRSITRSSIVEILPEH